MVTEISTNRYLTQREYDDLAGRAEIQAEIERCLRDTELREGEFFAGDVRYAVRLVPREQAAVVGELCLSGVIEVGEPGDVIEPGFGPGEINSGEELPC